PLASLSLTHVYYNPTDPLSLLCAWLALLPQALMIVYVTTLFCTRELECILMLSGQLFCEAINFALKRAVREERPKRIHGKGYGMPSSHAQFSAFFFLYLGLLLVRRGLGGKEMQRWKRKGYMAAAGVGSVAVAMSRVYLNYHTVRQVVVGYMAGLVCAVAWYAVTAWGREKVVMGWAGREWALWAGQVLWVRDRCLREDLVVEGWRRGKK
ncbi:PAP2-domain-containing protein, partial [Wilcoxina mikolae CBS 423.85]